MLKCFAAGESGFWSSSMHVAPHIVFLQHCRLNGQTPFVAQRTELSELHDWRASGLEGGGQPLGLTSKKIKSNTLNDFKGGKRFFFIYYYNIINATCILIKLRRFSYDL